ncbi:MAG: M28 family peptidase [Bacteroidia bacterium]|nr:MAG: M28 family peptidase [Bacteroidia bacterium]
MKRDITFIMILFLGFCNLSKAQDFSGFKDSITINILQKHVETLCDKQKGGRKFATEGEKNAANYIRDQFIKFGLSSSTTGNDKFFQNYTLSFDTLISFSIENQKKTLSYLSDFFTWEFCFLKDTSRADIVYGGFGLDGEKYTDYKNIDVKNKWVVVEINSPFDSSGNLMDQFDFDNPIDYSQINLKKEIAQENGAIGVIFRINSERYPDFLASVTKNWYHYRSKDKAAINRLIGIYPGIFASQNALDSLMGVNTEDFNERINSQLKDGFSLAGEIRNSVSFNINKQQRHFNSQNVVGIIKGKEETVGTIVTAHYDAVKYNDTLFYPGANDNASGTAAVIQLADIFSKIVRSGYIPEKSIAFVAFSGEEEDLIGSTYFIDHKPLLLDNNTININIDGIGLLDPTQQNKGSFTYILASDTEIARVKPGLLKLASHKEQPVSTIFLEDPNSSDHASFYYGGIHAICLMTGGALNHTPQDSQESINYQNFESVTRFIFDIILSYNQFSTVIK